MGAGLWEVRCKLEKRIARVFFIIVEQEIILLHGIIKKSQTAPKKDHDLAKKRQSLYQAATEQSKKNENKKGK